MFYFNVILPSLSQSLEWAISKRYLIEVIYKVILFTS
jgi:hypothetical protein